MITVISTSGLNASRSVQLINNLLKEIRKCLVGIPKEMLFSSVFDFLPIKTISLTREQEEAKGNTEEKNGAVYRPPP